MAVIPGAARRGPTPGSRHAVAVAIYDGVELLDVAGPMQVFSTAERVSRGRAGYELALVAERRGFVHTSVGVPLVADRSWHDLDADIGTVLVPGAMTTAEGTIRPLEDPALVGWLAESDVVAGSRVVSVCTGAHIVAAAGLLDGRRATTHWATSALLAVEHPGIEVATDAIFVEDDGRWSSGGMSAGIDLALAVVAADHGEDLARRVAQWLVVYLRRPGGQHQFSAFLGPRRSTSDRLGSMLTWIPDHLGEDLSLDALADRMSLSPRHLARLFGEEVGSTPAAYVERVRVQAAVDRLVQTDAPVTAVAAAAGFGSVASLHRAFRRQHGLSPGEYRRRFTQVDRDPPSSPEQP